MHATRLTLNPRPEQIRPSKKYLATIFAVISPNWHNERSTNLFAKLSSPAVDALRRAFKVQYAHHLDEARPAGLSSHSAAEQVHRETWTEFGADWAEWLEGGKEDGQGTNCCFHRDTNALQ